MKLFTSEAIRRIDAYTIKNEPVESIDLMERAAGSLLGWITANIERSRRIIVVAGPGNNGGDGLALARMLYHERYSVTVCTLHHSSKLSPDCATNMDRLRQITDITCIELKSPHDLPEVADNDIVIDAIFGTGLTRSAGALFGEVIDAINKLDVSVISVDIPSGLFSEDNSGNINGTVIRADVTLTLQFPKIAFLFSENEKYVGRYEVLTIGLSPVAIEAEESRFRMTAGSYVASELTTRRKFDHKGMFGHALIVAGSRGKTGAAILAARAAIRSGAGLVTAHLPGELGSVMHCSVPEVMVQYDQSDLLISEVTDIDKYDAIGMGPGIGQKPNTEKALRALLEKCSCGLVLDADALNIISSHRSILTRLPAGTILTPHPGEFERMMGEYDNGYSRLMAASDLASQTNAVIVLKGAYTAIVLPGGDIWFNTTGNPGMATAGSGDVLTGMITALLAQGCTSASAAISGVYLHGLAGDIAASKRGYQSLIASDIIDNIGESFL
ncbi:MAG: NAD(P)H-hydrate dehydratase, partial [Bacteroidales bacterium]